MAVSVGLVLLTLFGISVASKDPHYVDGHDVMVHLFEWKWEDIAKECEDFLGPRGFGGVQISPPNENLVINHRPWWERYQPVSYRLVTRSGNEVDFEDMVLRCNYAGVRIYADAVFNHMSAVAPNDAHGTDGSLAYYEEQWWPEVPYTARNFHNPPCNIEDHQDFNEVRVCQLLGAADLNQTSKDTRLKIIAYLNNLVDLGVAGFRIDAAKNMWPKDLAYIYSQLHSLSTPHGFQENTNPFIYQEVIDYGGGVVTSKDYTDLGLVTEFKHGSKLSEVFKSHNGLHLLKDWGERWDMLPSADALVFVDNHVTQYSESILNYKDPKPYRAAIAFMLASTYGTPRILSSYPLKDWDSGPEADDESNIISPVFNSDDTCSDGFICQHRWHQIYNMVTFRRTVAGTDMIQWWDNNENQIAFCRGNLGFIAINMDTHDLRENLQTCLPGGVYCDIISGSLINGRCTGKIVTVSEDGTANIEILAPGEDAVLAIHKNSRS